MERRRFLGALGLSAGGLAGATTRVHTGPVASWEPEPGTWPLERRDLANTAAASDATLPDDPTVAWETSSLSRVDALVVGPGRVFVARRPENADDGGSGPTVAALDRSSGETDWTADVPGGHLALREGTLYVGSAADDGDLAALDATSGEERWRTEVFPHDGDALTVADGTVYFGGGNYFVAVDADDGGSKWALPRVYLPFPAIAGGALYVCDGDVNRYRSRRLSDSLTARAPPVDWTSTVSKQGWPVVAGGRVLVGEHGRLETPGLHALDAATGDLDWRVTDALDLEQARYVRVGSPAVAGDVCVFDVQRPGPEEESQVEQEPPGPAVELVACSTADGSVRWRRPLPDARPHPVHWASTAQWTVVAGDAVLHRTEAGGDAGGGTVHAFGLDGQRRWAADVPAAPTALAPCGPTVYVGTDGGTVHAFE